MKILRKIPAVIGFACFYVKELFLSNLRVAYDAITPTMHARPGMIALPTDARTGWELLLLANLITMTPGTLSVDVSTDRKVIYIHAMYIDDPDKIRSEIKQNLERRILELFR